MKTENTTENTPKPSVQDPSVNVTVNSIFVLLAIVCLLTGFQNCTADTKTNVQTDAKVSQKN